MILYAETKFIPLQNRVVYTPSHFNKEIGL